MLRMVGRDSLPEFAAWAGDEREFLVRCIRPWLRGFRSPGGGSWLECPRALRVHDRRALLAMWRQARVQIDWLAEDTPGRAHAHDPLWGLSALPARWRPQWAQHSFQTGDSDDDPMFGAVPSDTFEPARRVLEWPVVPTGTYAPGTYSRRGPQQGMVCSTRALQARSTSQASRMRSRPQGGWC